MGCGSSKLKELQATTAARQSEIETLRASIATFELETAKHNEEERKAKSEKEATDAFAKSERKRIGAEEESKKAAAKAEQDALEAAIKAAEDATAMAIDEAATFHAEATQMEAELPRLETEHEEKTIVKLKAEKELKKREKDAVGARRMKERFAEAYASTQPKGATEIEIDALPPIKNRRFSKVEMPDSEDEDSDHGHDGKSNSNSNSSAEVEVEEEEADVKTKGAGDAEAEAGVELHPKAEPNSDGDGGGAGADAGGDHTTESKEEVVVAVVAASSGAGSGTTISLISSSSGEGDVPATTSAEPIAAADTGNTGDTADIANTNADADALTDGAGSANGGSNSAGAADAQHSSGGSRTTIPQPPPKALTSPAHADQPSIARAPDPFAAAERLTHQARLHAELKNAAGSDNELSKRELRKLFRNGSFTQMLENAGVLDMFDEDYDGVEDVAEIVDALDSNHDGKVDVEEAFQLIVDKIWAFGKGLPLNTVVQAAEDVSGSVEAGKPVMLAPSIIIAAPAMTHSPIPEAAASTAQAP